MEFSSEDEAPEGGTGSTFVDAPVSTALFQSQYLTTKLGLATAHTVASGVGVVVAVLDTGVDSTHAELASQVLTSGWDFIDGDAFPFDESSNQDADGDGLVDEMAGHGTYVAGLITLVAPDAKILPIRVLDSEGRGNIWSLVRGMWYAIDQGVEVINLSLGSTDESDVVQEAIEEARARGIAVVAAAGNCDRTEPEEFPAMEIDYVIGVAAVDNTETRAAFSNFHENLALSAPAVTTHDVNGDPILEESVISTIPGGGYAFWQGTSMATPLVAGTAALIRSQHPEWPAEQTTIDAVREALTSGALPIDVSNPDYAGLLGAGRVDANSSVLLGPVAPALGDLNADGVVNVVDLLLIINDWGMTHTSADLTGDGMVDVIDILSLIEHWG